MLSRRSEFGALRRVVVRSPEEATRGARHDWRDLGWSSPPDLSAAVREFEGFVRILEDAGAEVLRLEGDALTLDSIYTRDAAVATAGGMILGAMGKPERVGEPEAHGAAYRSWGIDVVGRIEGDGRLEGGDVVWLDRSTVAVGIGYRTNAEGVRQLADLLGDGTEVVPVPLPHGAGPGSVFHLMSMLSPVDRDLAVVHSAPMPVVFRERLLARGTTLVEVAPDEVDALGANVLAVAPRVCVMTEGAPATARRLQAAGCEVIRYAGREISLKGSGGPTCLTRPLERV